MKSSFLLIPILIVLISPAVFASGTFQSYKVYPLDLENQLAQGVAIGDLNGDGRNDVVTVSLWLNAPGYEYNVFVFIQGSDGEFKQPVVYPGGTGNSVALIDFNDDGRLDIVTTTTDGIGVLCQNADGSFGPLQGMPGIKSHKIKIGDVNNDGLPDIVSVGWSTNTVEVYRKKRDGTFAAPVSHWVKHGGWENLTLSDVNNDGLLDIVIGSGQGETNLGVVFQTSDGKLAPPLYPKTPYRSVASGVAAGDVTGDGLNDIVMSDMFRTSISVFSQAAAGGFETPTYFNTSEANPRFIAVADINGDGRSDILCSHDGWGSLGYFIQKIDGSFKTEQFFSMPANSTNDMAIGDVNGDGFQDVVVADQTVGLVVVRHAALPLGDEWWFRLGTLGGSGSAGYALSANGGAIVGKSTYDHWGGDTHAFLWTTDQGMTDLGRFEGEETAAYGISDDGTVVVGASTSKAFRWTKEGKMVDIGGRAAYGVSADGNVVVGFINYYSSAMHAFRWSLSEGIKDIGLDLGAERNSVAYGVSADGNIIVGWYDLKSGSHHAFRWTQSSGMVSLGTLGGLWSEAYAVSSQGGVVVGSAITSAGYERAFRWTQTGGMKNLGVLRGGTWSRSMGVSGNGRIVIGVGDDGSGKVRAFRWTEEGGLQTVEDWLSSNGLDISTFNIYSVLGISRDGKVVTGQLYDAQAFFARIGPKYSLTASARGRGTGTIKSSGAMIHFSYPESASDVINVIPRTDVTLTATAGYGSTVSWSGDCDLKVGTPKEATCVIYGIKADRKVVANFARDTVRVISPNGGEVVTSGLPVWVTWSTNEVFRAVAETTVYFTVDGGSTWKIASRASGNPGKISWMPPSVMNTSTECKLKVILKASDGTYLASDISDSVFTLKPGT